jgi:hypothetical protein
MGSCDKRACLQEAEDSPSLKLLPGNGLVETEID